MEKCCVCARALPNRYAVAGRCTATDCNQPFCALHWRNGNQRCPDHGGRVVEQSPGIGSVMTPEATHEPLTDSGETPMDSFDDKERAPSRDAPETRLSGARAKKVMKDVLRMAGRLGAGASELARRLKKDKSPGAMIETLRESLAANRRRREQASARLETLFREIAAQKKTYAGAPAARKPVLKAELKSKLAAYKAGERELNVLLENERVLSQLEGRLNEMIAYDMAGVTESMIDDVAVDVEDRVLEAESRVDVARDLEKAGRRRQSDDDDEEFLDDLAAFDEPLESAAAEEPAEADVRTPPPAEEPPDDDTAEPHGDDSPEPERS